MPTDPLRLSDAVRAEGYRFVIDPEPWTRLDVLGDPEDPQDFRTLLCQGTDGVKYLAGPTDSWDWQTVYSASHEICEDRVGHRHCDLLWMMQCNLLATWCEALAAQHIPDGGA